MQWSLINYILRQIHTKIIGLIKGSKPGFQASSITFQPVAAASEFTESLRSP